uniref:Immunoglobulin V-set domain-containing protein n=1 Tax=Dicentrarchus labrax TaxID=13489 RepID=A0A8P4K501_DICLA
MCHLMTKLLCGQSILDHHYLMKQLHATYSNSRVEQKQKLLFSLELVQIRAKGKPIVAIVGEDTILPCHLDPAVDPASTTLEWSRPDQGHRFVHVRHEGEDALTDQNPSYKGRTSVSNNTLKQGDVSLKLFRVELSDNGTYRRYIPKLNKESFISLAVGDMSLPPHKIVLVVAIPIMILCLIVFCLACDKRADDAEGSGSSGSDESFAEICYSVHWFPDLYCAV